MAFFVLNCLCMTKIAIIISPNWRDYAQRYLTDCLASFGAQKCSSKLKFFLIDNQSSTESLSFINQVATKELAGQEWMLLTSPDNLGFAGGNNLAIRQALAEGYDYLALFNMDGLVAPDCLEQMLVLAQADNQIGAVQARLMLWPDQSRINSLGNVTHFLGFGYCAGNGQVYRYAEDQDIAYPSGAAVLLSAEALQKIGDFDEEFWMYNEDQDLGWRLWLAGYRCRLANSAVFYHKYQFSKSIKHFYWQDRNRILACLKNYHLFSLLIFSPAFLISELGLWLTAWRAGWLGERFKVLGYFCLPSTWLYILAARRSAQSLRRRSDRSIIKLFSAQIKYQELDSPLTRLGNIVFRFYFSIVKPFIFW